MVMISARQFKWSYIWTHFFLYVLWCRNIIEEPREQKM